MVSTKQAPEKYRKWFAKEPLLPESWKFYSRNETRETACPLHSIFFLGDSDSLEELMPYLTKSDLEGKGPFDSSFLHMIISGIEYGAPQVSATKCAKILLSEAPILRDRTNSYNTTPLKYAKYLLTKFGGWDEKKVAALKDIIDVL